MRIFQLTCEAISVYENILSSVCDRCKDHSYKWGGIAGISFGRPDEKFLFTQADMNTTTSPLPDGQTSFKNAAVSPGKHTVLYIEDNFTIRQLLRYILDLRPGITLLEAENGIQGLEMVLLHKPGLILLDIHLPDMNGFTVFQRLQDNPDTANIPVVALSGSAAPSDIERALKTGFTKFLPKPLDIKELLSTLDAIFVP
jgi:CheY-like chemotaxis protein